MMRVLSRKQLRLGLFLALILLPMFAFAVLRVNAVGIPITVNSAADNTTNDALCTLREAILIANAGSNTAAGIAASNCGSITIDPLADEWAEISINFPAVINLNNELPTFQRPIHLIGGDATADDVIMQPAGGAGVLAYGLQIGAAAGGSQIEGLVIDGFTVGVDAVNVAPTTLAGLGFTQIGLPVANGGNKLINNGTGILVRGTASEDIAIDNNIIGLSDHLAPTLAGNSLDGIRVNGATNIEIGVGSSNIIGGSGRYGIFLNDVNNATIANNYIGRTPLGGAFAAPNGSSGILIDGGSNAVTIESNVIGSNVSHGVLVNSSTNTIIRQNEIGSAGGAAAGNGGAGIRIATNGVLVENNTAISNNAGAGILITGSNNIVQNNPEITNNGGDGVAVTGGVRNEIDRNSISENGGLGIDLSNNGVTANDGGDGDAGPNTLQNYPNLISAWTDGVNLILNGGFSTLAGTYELQFYTNTACDASNFGEGETYSHSFNLAAPAAFPLTVPTGGVGVGDFLTILVIDRTNATRDGNTSEFSRCVLVAAVVNPVAIITATPTSGTSPLFVNFTNLSTGTITAYEWYVNGSLVSTAFDYNPTFTTGTYDVFLRVYNGAFFDDSNIITITVSPPPPTPIPPPTNTPVPPPPPTDTPIPVIPTATFTRTPTPTRTPIPTATATFTRTATATRTATNTATATFTPTASRTATATYTATFTRTATATFTATFTRTASPTATSSPTATLTATATVTPDIDITKVDDGEDDVMIDIINNGDTTAPDVVVIEVLRPNVQYRAAQGQTNCLESSGLVTCRVGDIPPNATAEVDFSVIPNGVDPSSGQTTVIVGGVAVALIDEPYISKIGNPPVAAPGSEIIYTIRVINPTDESAFRVVVNDAMPEGIEILEAVATDGTLTIDGQNVELRLDELVAGGRVVITLTTRVSNLEVSPQLVNIACVSSSSNVSERCAQMSFLRAGELPNTGESSLFNSIVRWSIVLFLALGMLVGLGFLWHKMRRMG